ncbi:MAG: heme o synthase [Gammaproteobacteria bacterium]|nr:heme o synthase [Gammaproteobacteria bacterium]
MSSGTNTKNVNACVTVAALRHSRHRGFADCAYDYYQLTKPRVVSLIIFTAIVGMFLSVPGMVPIHVLLLATIGIGLAAASGAAVNQLLDVKVDALMSRTQGRPLPTGSISKYQALGFAVVLSGVSMAVLILGVNVLTAILTFASLIGYAVIYTVLLKRLTPQNIVIGGAAGAAPPVLGWSAVTGEVSADALLLFLIIFCWTPPHFWALALYRHKEYATAGIPMLPVTHGARFTRLQIVLYTLLLAAVSIMPFATQMSGWMYLIGALALNARFIHYALMLYRRYSDDLARRTFGFSIQYLAMLFGLMLVDHYREQWGALARYLIG